ncbi:MAG: hypothetical protein C0483_12150 [Pirellula sp.]|nr:hypothetical protein [Pirellula sp.]
MNGLSDIVVDYFLTIMFAAGDTIDADYQCRLQESLPENLNPLSAAEKEALSAAAQRRLDDIDGGPDEYGYKPGMLVTDDQRAFLVALATGELFDGLQA